MRPLLSIVIPTKDRYQYLIQLVELIQSFGSNEIETVIQDNTNDNSEIVEYLKIHGFKNLIYSHEPNQLTICENSDRAILNSSGKYVCYLGDDDGTTAEILNVVKWMEINNIEAAISSPVYYQWPDAFSTEENLLKYKKSKQEIKICDTDKIFRKCLSEGFTFRDGMPGVYHGIVSRFVLDKIYNKCSTFFPGASPDIANCVAVCLSIDRYAYIDSNIVINGAGSQHGGGNYRKDISLRKLPFLPKDIVENWEHKVPRAWTATTIWCESALKALKSMERPDLVKKCNYNYMYAVFITLYPSHINLIKELKPNLIYLGFQIIKRLLKSISHRISSMAPINKREIQNLRNIKEVVETLSVHNDQKWFKKI